MRDEYQYLILYQIALLNWKKYGIGKVLYCISMIYDMYAFDLIATWTSLLEGICHSLATPEANCAKFNKIRSLRGRQYIKIVITISHH